MKPIWPLGTVVAPVARSQSGETSRPNRRSSSPCSQNSARTRHVQPSMSCCGLQGLEMSAAWTTVSKRKSFLSRALCLSAGLSEDIRSSSSGSSTKLLSSCTCVECFAMSVASTMAMRPFRTYCCKWISWLPAWPGTSRGSSENQSDSGSDCMVSKASAMCMFSKMLLSLYRIASGDIVLEWKRLFLPGWPTSWIAAATKLIKWSSCEVRSRMY
mmetsp:Transcript_69385/g.178837  ORF Transcript_69385/g.178837 Transcript_69385/m.178837 type:complete len:214 (-) Transcript_69385:848-1489(-)